MEIKKLYYIIIGMFAVLMFAGAIYLFPTTNMLGKVFLGLVMLDSIGAFALLMYLCAWPILHKLIKKHRQTIDKTIKLFLGIDNYVLELRNFRRYKVFESADSFIVDCDMYLYNTLYGTRITLGSLKTNGKYITEPKIKRKYKSLFADIETRLKTKYKIEISNIEISFVWGYILDAMIWKSAEKTYLELDMGDFQFLKERNP